MNGAKGTARNPTRLAGHVGGQGLPTIIPLRGPCCYFISRHSGAGPLLFCIVATFRLSPPIVTIQLDSQLLIERFPAWPAIRQFSLHRSTHHPSFRSNSYRQSNGTGRENLWRTEDVVALVACPSTAHANWPPAYLGTRWPCPTGFSVPSDHVIGTVGRRHEDDLSPCR